MDEPDPGVTEACRVLSELIVNVEAVRRAAGKREALLYALYALRRLQRDPDRRLRDFDRDRDHRRHWWAA